MTSSVIRASGRAQVAPGHVHWHNDATQGAVTFDERRMERGAFEVKPHALVPCFGSDELISAPLRTKRSRANPKVAKKKAH